MQISGPESVQRNIFANPQQSSIRVASYDIPLGALIHDGDVFDDDIYDIEPGQIVILVSRDRIDVPCGHVGYAMPKTSLCFKGLLALSTGILDPGYKGLIATTVINFSKKPIRMCRNDSVLRLVFHELTGKDANSQRGSIDIPDGQYIEDRKKDSKSYSGTFLDIPGQIKKWSGQISDDILQRQNSRMGIWLGAAMLLIAVINAGTFFFVSHQETVLSERLMCAKPPEITNEVNELKARVIYLEEQQKKRSAK